MNLQQIANWHTSQNPLHKVLGNNSICPTITTRIAETDAGGVNYSTILISEDLEETTDLRGIYITDERAKKEYFTKRKTM